MREKVGFFYSPEEGKKGVAKKRRRMREQTLRGPMLCDKQSMWEEKGEEKGTLFPSGRERTAGEWHRGGDGIMRRGTL